MGLLIKNGTIVSADASRLGDIRCRDGLIAEVGRDLEGASEREVDASGAYILPGGVDPHVHMELPVAGTVSADDFESGSSAALAGGTTTIIDFVHPERGEDFLAALAARRQLARAAVTDYGLHMAITWWGDDSARAMAECARRGVSSFKIYLAYKATVGLDDRDVIRALASAAEIDALTLVHAEHGEMVDHLRTAFAEAGDTTPRYHALSRPPRLEGEATRRATALASTLGAELYVVHVTCREAARAIAEARAAGWPIHGETCPQYLVLDDSAYEGDDAAAYVIAPPLRPRVHQAELWSALSEGVIEAVGSDHCPFTREQKLLGRDDFRRIPGGAAGVEHRLALLYTYGVGSGRIDIQRFVDLVSTRPAKLFGLYPRKGSLEVGADADLTVWDPEATARISASTHHHRTDSSIYEGVELRGLPAAVVANGRLVWVDGSLEVERGAGRFLARSRVSQR